MLGLRNAGNCGGKEFSVASLSNKVRLIEIDWALRAPTEALFINNREGTRLASG